MNLANQGSPKHFPRFLKVIKFVHSNNFIAISLRHIYFIYGLIHQELILNLEVDLRSINKQTFKFILKTKRCLHQKPLFLLERFEKFNKNACHLFLLL